MKPKQKEPVADEKYREAAKRLYEDEGSIEIDPGATVSSAGKEDDEGAYVQAWVWVPKEEL